MKITHKTHLPRQIRPAEIGEAYQGEVDRATQRLQRRWERARKAVEAARFRRERVVLMVGQDKLRARRLVEAEAALSARLAELGAIERLMTESPASATHRGREGWTKVPR